jgi:hypothetical protein
MFFTELSTKDNAVYNHFVDMFSLLSAEKDLEEDALKRIIKFLAGFIEKVIPASSHLHSSIANTCNRINTPSSLLKNLPPDCLDARLRDSGTMLRMRSVCSSTRMRKSRNW